MPFQRELDSIVRDVRGALGAILVDFEGEAVVTSSTGISAYDLKVVGAYGVLFFDNLRRLSGETGAGAPSLFSIDGSGCRILCAPLKDGYHLVLVGGASTHVSIAAEKLRSCAERLVHEL